MTGAPNRLADKAAEAAAVERTPPLPTVFVPSPTQVEDIIAKIMPTADQMRDDDYGFPDAVSRRDIIQTAEHSGLLSGPRSHTRHWPGVRS